MIEIVPKGLEESQGIVPNVSLFLQRNRNLLINLLPILEKGSGSTNMFICCDERGSIQWRRSFYHPARYFVIHDPLRFHDKQKLQNLHEEASSTQHPCLKHSHKIL